MKKSLHTFILFLVALIMPTAASAFELITEGVYMDGNTLYIGSNVTSITGLQVNPSVIYTFAANPPECDENTFMGYDGVLHVPATSFTDYFISDYWGNFADIRNDAVEPTGVNLNYYQIELIVGDSFNLYATVQPSNATPQTVDWTSSDPLVAEVSAGRISAIAPGECDIIVSCLDKQTVCHVSIVEPISVTLDQTELTLEQTDQVTLTATVTPESSSGISVTWSSTDESIATVENGVVTAIGVGECDIIASYFDKHAVCHVTVVETTIYITLDRHEARLLPNHLLTLTPTMSPISTTLKVTSTNPAVAIAKLVNGSVQVAGRVEGTTLIIVGSEDGNAIADTCEVTVYTELGDVNCDGYVSIKDVTTLIDYLLTNNETGLNVSNGDVNRDEIVSIKDVTAMIDYLLGGNIWPWEGEVINVKGVSFMMINVEGGTFTMGASDIDEDAASNERPAHEVTLSSYSIGQMEVTQELWQAVMGVNPSRFSSANGYSENLKRPVEQVSWNDCQEFVAKLNELTGKSFRLPTEAEWEYAARGGNKSMSNKYAGSNTVDDVAWYMSNAGSGVGTNNPNYGTHEVNSKDANELGLYGMSGNVSEWCQDWMAQYRSTAQTDPTGPVNGSIRVHRGGGWNSNAINCRVSARNGSAMAFKANTIGLRLAL